MRGRTECDVGKGGEGGEHGWRRREVECGEIKSLFSNVEG